MKATGRFEVGRHPNWKDRFSYFKWAVFAPNGTLFEGFRDRWRAEEAAKEYNANLQKERW